MKTLSFFHHTLAAAVLAGAMLYPATAGAQCDDTDSQWQRVEVNLGSVPAPIVGNAGQLDDDVAFAALGATGTGIRFAPGGGSIVLVDLEHRVARVGFQPIDVDGPAALAPTEPVWGSVMYIVAGGPTVLPAWGAVEAHGLWGGATIEHRVTGRTWRMHLTGAAADIGRLSWQLTGVAEVIADERSGDLRLTLEDSERQLTLHPAIASVGEDTQYLPFVADAEGTIRLGGEVPEGATLDTVLVMAPYYHDGDAVADGRGGYLATGIAVDAVETGGASGRDVAVVRTEADGRSFAGMTILASSGDDTAAGIASRAGDAYLTGTAGAADFPLAAGKGGGETWPAPFAVRLGTSGELAAGGYLRAHGLDAARDVAVDAEGRVLISGQASAKAKDTGDAELTAVLPADDGAPRVRYGVARFDSQLSAADSLRTFEGADTGMPLELRIGCDGGISVGLDPLAAGGAECVDQFPTWRTRTYEAPGTAGIGWVDFTARDRWPAQQNYPYSNWGLHALSWKANSQGIFAYDPTDAIAAGVPHGQVAISGAGGLNAIEADPTVFSADPAGTWEANLATTPGLEGLEAAIGAAAYAEFWDSPTYLNLKLGTTETDGAGVLQVDFCVLADANGNFPGPLEICPRTLPIDDFDADCIANYSIVSDDNRIRLDQVRVHHWFDTLSRELEEFMMSGDDFIDKFEDAMPGTVYVGDPPADERFSAGQVREAVDRRLALMVEEVPVEIFTVTAGGQAPAEAGFGVVRSVDR